eukprot:GHRR01024696.1.p1 GENE.GHRR01024696.1~~GHRR01024696.1.p1  ORF type:complete len:160 (+),score=36.26 GHRR01024696.1:266-745(+)
MSASPWLVPMSRGRSSVGSLIRCLSPWVAGTTGPVASSSFVGCVGGPSSFLPNILQRRCLNSGNDFELDEKMGRPTTPWVRQVISGVDLMRHPKYNKGLAFSESERDRLYLRGLLPPAVLSQEVQLERAIRNIRSKEDPLDKYTYLSSLQGRNERLFYR